MWSMDQGTAVAKEIISGNVMGISDTFFEQNRGTVAYIFEADNNLQSIIYYTRYTRQSKRSVSISIGAWKYVNDAGTNPMCHKLPRN